MSDLYNVLSNLLIQKGVSGYRMCQELSISPSLMTDLKSGRKKTVNAKTAQKIADYFGVTVGFLLGEEKEKAPVNTDKRSISDDDIKFALFGGDGEITDSMFEEVKQFAAMIKLREEHKKND